MVVITSPTLIRAFQLKVVISAIKLEQKGMRHSSGRSVKAMWARKFGLSSHTKAEEVIQRLQEQINHYEAEHEMANLPPM